MAGITGIGKDAALAILGESVVSGTISESGHLILTRQNGETIDAGDFTTVIEDLIEESLGVAATFKNINVGTIALDQVAQVVQGYTGQTANLLELRKADGTLLARFNKDGNLLTPAITGATIDGDLNTMSNISATKLQGHLVTVASVAPSTPAAGDIWINTTGV